MSDKSTIYLCDEASAIIELSDIKSKSCIFKGWWTKEDCLKNKNALFVFGDNDIKRGIGGQAIIRLFRNSFGIPTKKYPNYKSISYYADREYDKQCEKIIDSIEDLIIKSEHYDVIYFPEDGLGTGLAKLNIKSPKTFEFLNCVIKEIFGIEF
jgi:hypothetical protein